MQCSCAAVVIAVSSLAVEVVIASGRAASGSPPRHHSLYITVRSYSRARSLSCASPSHFSFVEIYIVHPPGCRGQPTPSKALIMRCDSCLTGQPDREKHSGQRSVWPRLRLPYIPSSTGPASPPYNFQLIPDNSSASLRASSLHSLYQLPPSFSTAFRDPTTARELSGAAM